MLKSLQRVQTYQSTHKGKIFNLTGECILILKWFLISQFTHEPMCFAETPPLCITEVPLFASLVLELPFTFYLCDEWICLQITELLRFFPQKD